MYVFYFQTILLSFVFYRSSTTLSIFIDEYLSLASNVNFFTSLDFNAGERAGGSYSVVLTSGPLSSLGSVIGWSFTNNLVFARFFNFLWGLILHISFSKILSAHYDINRNLFLIFSSFSLLILPWYFGLLYSLGEVTSTIVFFYGLLLFTQKRKLSLLLLSLSIFYGKLILVFIFVIFYLFYIQINKEHKNIFSDMFIFCIPGFIWLILVSTSYQDGSIYKYISDFIYFNFTNNRSAGLKEISSFGILDYIFSYKNTEVLNWNFADILRVLVSPIIFSLYSFKYLKKSNYLSKLLIPIICSSLALYLWFWIFSPTKWIRYSQHFLLIQILLILFTLSHNKFTVKNFTQLALLCLYVSLFFNSMELIIIFYLSILVLKFIRTIFVEKYLSLTIILFLFINAINSYYELGSKSIFEFEFNECKNSLHTEMCYQEYINQ